jgi:hypothetical protein
VDEERVESEKKEKKRVRWIKGGNGDGGVNREKNKKRTKKNGE